MMELSGLFEGFRNCVHNLNQNIQQLVENSQRANLLNQEFISQNQQLIYQNQYLIDQNRIFLQSKISNPMNEEYEINMSPHKDQKPKIQKQNTTKNRNLFQIAKILLKWFRIKKQNNSLMLKQFNEKYPLATLLNYQRLFKKAILLNFDFQREKINESKLSILKNFIPKDFKSYKNLPTDTLKRFLEEFVNRFSQFPFNELSETNEPLHSSTTQNLSHFKNELQEVQPFISLVQPIDQFNFIQDQPVFNFTNYNFSDQPTFNQPTFNFSDEEFKLVY